MEEGSPRLMSMSPHRALGSVTGISTEVTAGRLQNAAPKLQLSHQ